MTSSVLRARTWRDVNPSLPAIPIRVYGPPPTSGTRDSFVELMLERGCDTDPAMAALKAYLEHLQGLGEVRRKGRGWEARER